MKYLIIYNKISDFFRNYIYVDTYIKLKEIYNRIDKNINEVNIYQRTYKNKLVKIDEVKLK
jgi:hypothetical protein